MSALSPEDVWEVRGLPVIEESTNQSAPPLLPTTPGEDGGGDGGVAGRVAIFRKERFVRLEQERRRETRLVEACIEQRAVDLARRMERMLGYGEDDVTRWKSRIEPHHFNTYSAADFVSLMDDLRDIYRVRQDIIVECISSQMSLEAERTARLRSIFKKYHPLLTRAFHKMPAEVEEQLELEVVAINEMVLGNLRRYAEIRFNRLTCEIRSRQKLVSLWQARRDAWRTLNIRQAKKHLSSWLEASAVESRVEAPLTELETEMSTVWQHYREHLTELPDLFLKMVTDESLDQWQDEAYEILNAMSAMFTTHCKSYQRLYVNLENAWYEQLEHVGDDLVSREVTDADAWEELADKHTEAMFGPIKKKVEENMQNAQKRWDVVVKTAPNQVDHLYSYIASSCEVFSLHLAERDRCAKKLEVQLAAVDKQQAAKEVQLEQKVTKSVVAMMEESKVNKVRQIQQNLEKTMMGFLPTYEQCQERRLTLLLAYSERLEVETLEAQQSVSERLEGTVMPFPRPPDPPPADCHRLLTALCGVLLLPEELAELQRLSAANIRWYLTWERRKMEQSLGDFLLEKLELLKDRFDDKVDGLSKRVREIETTVHDRRSSEIQLHQQRVDSHCTSVAEQLTDLASQLSAQLEWMRVRLEEVRLWVQQHELKSRTAERSYLLQMMLTQMREKEEEFIDCIVTRSQEFRKQVEEFLVDLVASTEAFMNQLIPQADPQSLLEPPPGARPSSVSARGADSVRTAVLRENAAKAAAKSGERRGTYPGSRAGSVSASGRRRGRRGSPKKKGNEPEQIGNFSQDEIDKYKNTLKKLLFTIDASGKVHVKSLEHKMEMFCAQLDDAIKKAYTSIMSQLGDIRLSEGMQHSYVSIQTLIKFEIRLNQEETQKTRALIKDLENTLDSYEGKWKMNLKQESQLNVYFQPKNTIEWDAQLVRLSDCLVEGMATLDIVTQIFAQITARHLYLYFAPLDGTVPFSVPHTEPLTESNLSGEGEEATSAPSETIGVSFSVAPSQTNAAASAGRQSAKSGKSVRLSGASSQAAPTSHPATDSTHSKGWGRKGGHSQVSVVSSTAGGAEVSAISNGTATLPGSSNYAADVSNNQETNTAASGPASGPASAAPSQAPSSAGTSKPKGKHKPNKKTTKRRRREVKPQLSKLQDPEVRLMIFGDTDEPDDSDNFIQKIRRKILAVLDETRDFADEFYATKSGRSVARPGLIPTSFEEFLEIVFGRFQAYYGESTQYQLTCFAEFCTEFTQFACIVARIPGLLFGHQATLFCRKVAALTRQGVRDISGLQNSWRQMAAELERRLRPSLGHPNMHPQLLQLVEHCVSEKEAYSDRLRLLDDTYTAERDTIEKDFDHGTAYIAQRCDTVLTSLTAAAHLSEDGLTVLREMLSEAVHRARDDCVRDWALESGAAQETWVEAMGQAVEKCRKWETAWFGGVETIQELFRFCDG